MLGILTRYRTLYGLHWLGYGFQEDYMWTEHPLSKCEPFSASHFIERRKHILFLEEYIRFRREPTKANEIVPFYVLKYREAQVKEPTVKPCPPEAKAPTKETMAKPIPPKVGCCDKLKCMWRKMCRLFSSTTEEPVQLTEPETESILSQ